MEAARRIARLSPRERQVLDKLVTGRLTKQIAYDLGISARTVEVHRARMFARLGTARPLRRFGWRYWRNWRLSMSDRRPPIGHTAWSRGRCRNRQRHYLRGMVALWR